ncbi:hypothetical protein SLEP1_g49994 [Rubroshorea leprosula]|uniref:Aminotransferase-like plant mobile domain-containing protein n=1 Tax=Rubroshorea leprosula TaxID=152421 RepID=A0AAV5M132_9ROSI|nr:hypothetical protein SLEP1_g49994 [Rubroshorea leprosula]
MEETRETIVEEREEVMVSLYGDDKSYLRTAHFLSPSLASIDEPVPKLPPLFSSFLHPTFEPGNRPLKVSLSGWSHPNNKWISWVENLRPKYQHLWKKAGIFYAIISSTFPFRRHSDLIIGLAEKWSPETNSFIFPWAETTISLEDVMILGAYSVLGSPVFCSVETQELKEIEDELNRERKRIQKGISRNENIWKWEKRFMGSGSNIEHEAFLSFWLSRFVFRYPIIRKHVLPIAVHLARGMCMALAPAVLASIYNDLSLLKETIVSTKLEACEAFILSSPLVLVQLWAWERFPELQPKPNVLNYGDPRSARWKEVNGVRVENVRMVLDAAGESFQWRPYAKVLNHWQFPKFYKEKEELVSVDLRLDDELFSFALCLRPSELVGVGCIQQYLPHRVAMQFGMDQDIPYHVARYNETPEGAWDYYLRPIYDEKLYVPSRFFESDVTVRYLKWWRKQTIVRRKRSSRKKRKRITWASDGRKGDNDASVPVGFPPKFIRVKTEGFVEEENTSHETSNATPLMCGVDKSKGLSMSDSGDSATMNGIGQRKWKKTPSISEGRKEDNDASVPPGFLPKIIKVKTKDFDEEEKLEMRSCKKHDTSNETNENEVVYQEYNKEKTGSFIEESNFASLHMMVSKLETRIARLERKVEQIKAARKGQEVKES